MEKLIINSLSIAHNWGLWLSKDSYKSLIVFPKLKNVAQNNWAEDDGIEVDLESTSLDSRNLTLNFFCKENSYQNFISYLLNNGYCDFYFPEIDRYYNLRINSNSLKEYRNKAEQFTINFIDDKPLYGYEKKSTDIDYLTLVNSSNLIFDNVDLSDYGISILQGTQNALLELPKIKQRLNINNKFENGAWYDDRQQKFESKNLVLKLMIRAKDFKTTIANYYDFMRKISLPNIHTLQYQDNLLDVYYQNTAVNSVVDKLMSGYGGISFNVTFCVTKITKLL